MNALAKMAAIGEGVIDSIIQDVAELPDRTSPENFPDAMLVTADELRAILRAHLFESEPEVSIRVSLPPIEAPSVADVTDFEAAIEAAHRRLDDLTPRPTKRFEFDTWAEDEAGWDPETKAPGIMKFASAVQVWSALQNRAVTVAECARVFNVDAKRVIEAVDEHSYMKVAGPRGDPDRATIEHTGGE